MDKDLEQRQRIIDEEYRAESLRVVQAGGIFSQRLADLLDEQEKLTKEYIRREERKMLRAALIGGVLFLVLWGLVKLLEGKI